MISDLGVQNIKILTKMNVYRVQMGAKAGNKKDLPNGHGVQDNR